MNRRCTIIGVLLTMYGTLGAAHAQELLPFLVQSLCIDAAGAVMPGVLPFEPGCTRRAPANRGAFLAYRRHDWPAIEHAARQPQGYQAQDATLGTLLGQPAVIHGFDFGGDATRQFGVLDRGRGDGGQVVALADSEAFIVMTEDAGGGMQWFLSPDCAQGERGWKGWLLAKAPVDEAWSERLVRLRIAPSAEACPRAFDVSLTRWRRDRVALPWREAATGVEARVPAEVIVSEHFGGDAVARADHLERFFLARDLGMVRWERWENLARSRLPNRVAMAEMISRQRRCPALAHSVPPAPDWVMVDCRMWTNVVRATADKPLRVLDWP